MEPGHQLCVRVINIWPRTTRKVDPEPDVNSDQMTSPAANIDHISFPLYLNLDHFPRKWLNSILFFARPVSEDVFASRLLATRVPEDFGKVVWVYCLRRPHEQEAAEVVLEEGGENSPVRRTARAQHAEAEKPPDL